jgi:uncharacterized protein
MATGQSAHAGVIAIMHAQRAQFPNGRWHFQHGPMDIVIGADGDPASLKNAHRQAWERFKTILQELVQELPVLRRPVQGAYPVAGPIAKRMWSACQPFQSGFITPMAAVAGSVAQELLRYYAAPGIKRVWINNGGDIALHLAANESIRVGLYANLAHLNPQQVRNGIIVDGQFEVHSTSPVRGVATSGWQGRSFSLGIADSVTVLAATAAQADAAATVIANAVNVNDARIVRRPARELKDDSDLGAIEVTVDVPPLEADLVDQALAAGLARAWVLRAQGLICAAVLVCQNRRMTTENTFEFPARSRETIPPLHRDYA